MNFGQAFLFLFACATLGGVEGKGGTRGLATSIEEEKRNIGGFSEKLGSCENGAMCGKCIYRPTCVIFSVATIAEYNNNL